MACLESDYSMFQEESDFESDCSFMSDEDEENVAPPSKGSKPAPVAKSVLSDNTGANNVGAKKKGKKTVEEIYQKKTQLEHILLRPDTYIGSVERLTEVKFVLDEQTDRIVSREITFTPGLFKIFDESEFTYYLCFEFFLAIVVLPAPCSPFDFQLS